MPWQSSVPNAYDCGPVIHWKTAPFLYDCRAATAAKAANDWSLPRFWISIRSYKKQLVKKIWGIILDLGGHSMTMWTQFWPSLTTTYLQVDIFNLESGQKLALFWPHTTSLCQRSHWMSPCLAQIWRGGPVTGWARNPKTELLALCRNIVGKSDTSKDERSNKILVVDFRCPRSKQIRMLFRGYSLILWIDIVQLVKVAKSQKVFSLWLKSQKKVPNHDPEHCSPKKKKLRVSFFLRFEPKWKSFWD